MEPVNILVEMDLAGAEWVVVAYCANDPRMIQVIEEGRDPHLETAQLITSAPASLILKEDKLCKHTTDPVELDEIRHEQIPEIFDANVVKFLPRTMTIRQCGKKTNHGANYRMGPNQFADFAELDSREAKRVLDMYTTQAYPNIPIWWESIEKQLRIDLTIKNCFGRKRRFMTPWCLDVIKAAIAFVPQSTVSEVTTIGMKRVISDNDLTSRVSLLANVHDSLLNQLYVTDWLQAASDCNRIRKYMSQPCTYSGRQFTIKVDMKVGLSWGKMVGVAISDDLYKVAADLKTAIQELQHNTKTAVT